MGRPGERQPRAERVRALVGVGFAVAALASGRLVAQVLGGMVLTATVLVSALSWTARRKDRGAEREALTALNPLMSQSTPATSRDVTLRKTIR